MKKLSPLKAIKAKCMDCSCGSYKEVKNCVIPNCPIYPYRLGHKPKADRLQNDPQFNSPLTKGHISDEIIKKGILT